MSKIKTKYVCQSCGYSSLRWSGKCPECGTWSSMVEEIISVDKRKSNSASIKVNDDSYRLISEISLVNESRVQTNISELDRVLGGGIVSGSVILIGGRSRYR